MSLHNKPLTDLEKSGLTKHGLPTDRPSQLSDVFRFGIAWALSAAKDECNHVWIAKDSGLVSHAVCQKCGVCPNIDDKA